jgi:hypothetical protein
VLLGKAKEAIVTMKKVLPEKQKAVPPTTEAKTTAQKAVDDAAPRSRLCPEQTGCGLEKQLKDAQDKLITAKMTEVSALAAVSAAESNVKDAEDEVKRITDSKAKNAKAVAAANAAIAAAKTTQDKATADLAALKLALTKTTTKPVAVSFSADCAARGRRCLKMARSRVWAAATGTPIEESGGNGACNHNDHCPRPMARFVASNARHTDLSAARRAGRWSARSTRRVSSPIA